MEGRSDKMKLIQKIALWPFHNLMMCSFKPIRLWRKMQIVGRLNLITKALNNRFITTTKIVLKFM